MGTHAEFGIEHFPPRCEQLRGGLHLPRPIAEEMGQVKIRRREQQRAGRHALELDRARFVMPNFCPLFQQVAPAMRAKAKRDFQRIRGVAQLDAQQLTIRGFIRSRRAFIQQCSRGVAIGMRNLQRRFPDVTVTPLRIRLVKSLWRFNHLRSAKGVLVKAAIVAHLKIQRQALGF